MTVAFITILNDVITGKHHGDINSDLFGTMFFGHERLEVPFEAEIVAMDLVQYYNDNWVRKTEHQLITDELLPMPEGHLWEGDALRAMLAVKSQPGWPLKVEWPD